MRDLDETRHARRSEFLRLIDVDPAYDKLPIRRVFYRDQPQVSGTLANFLAHLEGLAEFAAGYNRTRQRVDLDHCPVDASSIVTRLRNLASTGDLGDSLLCIGDNDHISPVAAASGLFTRIVVVDREPGVLEDVATLNASLGATTPIVCQQLDVRHEDDVASFCQREQRIFTTATADPPYTSAGYMAFMRLGVQCLRLGGAFHLIVPYMLLEPWATNLLHDVQLYGIMNGLALTDIWRGAQTFQTGSGVVSSQLRFERNALVDQEHPIVTDAFYTLERLWR